VYDPAVRSLILKMHEPPFARLSIDEASLMRPVNRRITLRKYYLFSYGP
jgi:hypothetical protein